MDPGKDISGVVLAGGLSSRFGSDKALALLHGKPLIQHAADTLSAIFADCFLVANNPESYRFLNLPVIGDLYRGKGPLAGIHAALHHTEKPWIFVLGCDMPAVTPELVYLLCSLVHEEHDAVIPWPETGAEPLCGLYQKTALKNIERQLQGSEYGMKSLLARLSVRKVAEEELQGAGGSAEMFANVNRLKDLAGLK